MTRDNFIDLFTNTITAAEDLLLSKSDGYASDDDVLHNFKQAAKLQSVSPVSALAGMMAKHTISLYDMIRDAEDGAEYGLNKWDEKILDHINYLILLRALLSEKVGEYNN